MLAATLMRTFISDIIPRLQRFSKKLDRNSTLTNKNWVLLSDEPDKKIVYIFSEKENLLRIAENGRIKKGKWGYLGNSSIEIDIDNEPMLFKHAFLDEHLLALKLDGTEEFALLINELNYDNFLNTIEKLNSFLEDTYLKQTTKSFSGLQKQITNIAINSDQPFNQNDFPSLAIELETLKRKLQNYPKRNVTDIIVSYSKDHLLKNEWFQSNPKLSEDIAKQEVALNEIEMLFNVSRTNPNFQEQFKNFIRQELE
ncbi:MAG: hypothetical protein ABIO56_16015 [Ferruginibacter sp.]